MGSMRVAKVILVPRPIGAIMGGSSIPINESWPMGVPPTISMSGMTFPIPQSLKSVSIPVSSISYDAWGEYRDWYGVVNEHSFFIADILNRFWDRETFRRKIEFSECETALVQPHGDHYKIGWSDGFSASEFVVWFQQQEKKHRFKTKLPGEIKAQEVEQWLKDNVQGPYHFHAVGGLGGNGANVVIKDPHEAFHYEMRWHLPINETA